MKEMRIRIHLKKKKDRQLIHTWMEAEKLINWMINKAAVDLARQVNEMICGVTVDLRKPVNRKGLRDLVDGRHR